MDITETTVVRSILRVTRQCTTSLALRLGFVLQDYDGTEECMLLAAGLHRVDPTLSAKIGATQSHGPCPCDACRTAVGALVLLQ